MSAQVIIGIGSNLCEPKLQVSKAIECVGKLDSTKLLRASSLYTSSPQGPQDQDDFCNAAALLETDLTADQLLHALQSIEQAFGRIKTRHWGERIIDLDIIFYDQETIHMKEPDLTIPHPFCLTRDFVVIPVLEIVPQWKLPDGTLLSIAATNIESHSLQRLTPP